MSFVCVSIALCSLAGQAEGGREERGSKLTKGYGERPPRLVMVPCF